MLVAQLHRTVGEACPRMWRLGASAPPRYCSSRASLQRIYATFTIGRTAAVFAPTGMPSSRINPVPHNQRDPVGPALAGKASVQTIPLRRLAVAPRHRISNESRLIRLNQLFNNSTNRASHGSASVSGVTLSLASRRSISWTSMTPSSANNSRICSPPPQKVSP